MEINITAKIKGEEHIVNVDNDMALMRTFDLNSNTNDPIDLYVDGQLLV